MTIYLFWSSGVEANHRAGLGLGDRNSHWVGHVAETGEGIEGGRQKSSRAQANWLKVVICLTTVIVAGDLLSQK